jgi:hypothetical protein
MYSPKHAVSNLAFELNLRLANKFDALTSTSRRNS